MKKVRVCFEIAGFAVEDDGSRAPAGIEVVLGEVTDEKYASVDYTNAISKININGKLIDEVLRMPGIREMHIQPEDVTIITPEDYDRKYAKELD